MSDSASTNGAHDPAVPSPSPWVKLTITPEPSGDEGDALIGAITAYLSAQAAAAQAVTEASHEAPSRWRWAGRRESVRGRGNSPRMGWGREHVGWG